MQNELLRLKQQQERVELQRKIKEKELQVYACGCMCFGSQGPLQFVTGEPNTGYKTNTWLPNSRHPFTVSPLVSAAPKDHQETRPCPRPCQAPTCGTSCNSASAHRSSWGERGHHCKASHTQRCREVCQLDATRCPCRV